MKELQDKIAIVTGGARGIGRAITTEFINSGSNVIIFDKYYPEDFESYINEIKSKEGNITSKVIDITDTEATQKACDEVAKEFERIDILVNNAGITRDKLMLRMTEEDWDSVLSVNLKGAFNAIRSVVKTMARQRYGKIINISSVVGLMGNAGQANYAASKAGLIGLTKSVAKEFAGRNINVNCVAPGFVETEMTASLTEDQRKAFLDFIPLKRASKPDEIAGVVSFLASERASYITGQVICIDGGMVM